MKPRFVDTNVFLEAYVRTGPKSDSCIRFLQDLSQELWTTDLVVVEIEWVMRSGYAVPKNKVIEVIESVLNLSNLRIEKRGQLFKAIELYRANNIDFTDCFDAVQTVDQGIGEVYSFDRDFNKFKFLKRLEP